MTAGVAVGIVVAPLFAIDIVVINPIFERGVGNFFLELFGKSENNSFARDLVVVGRVEVRVGRHFNCRGRGALELLLLQRQNQIQFSFFWKKRT